MKNKTAMQELIGWIDKFPAYGLSRSDVRHKAKELLEKEKQTIIDAVNTCSNVLIANEIVINGNQELTVGENYYNQTYNQ